MSHAELDALYGRARPGPIPEGPGDGTVIFAPAKPIARPAAELTRLIAWKGKVFDSRSGTLANEIGPLGSRAIRASVSLDESWFDGAQAIVLDYSRTSAVAHWVRDEIREVAPGLYLGIAYLKHHKVLNFSLRFPGRPQFRSRRTA